VGEYGYVYILASGFKRLYIGVTGNLEGRIWQHKHPDDERSFTARYGINQLVYFERHPLMVSAIAREKQLKGWTRAKKIALIVAENPTWRDLSAEWGQPIEAWSERNEARVPAKYRDPSRRSG
jgi:putative endonuclease